MSLIVYITIIITSKYFYFKIITQIKKKFNKYLIKCLTKRFFCVIFKNVIDYIHGFICYIFMKEGKIMKKFILIALLIVSIILLSCAEKDAKTKEKDDTPPDLPAIDMEGKTFRIFTAGWWDYPPLLITDITSEGLNSEPINDAVYNRQIYLEDKYNIKIEQIDFPGEWGSSEKIITTVQANDDVYDLAFIRSMHFNSIATSDTIIDLTEITSMDVSRSWWDSNSYDSLSLRGKHYGICSDITMNDDLAVWCVFFNKDMVKNYGLENPYNLVKEGKWTYDKVFETGKLISKDLNSDGVMDKNDIFGIHHIQDSGSGIINCVGVNIGELDSAGNLVFTLDRENNMTKMLSIFTRLFDLDNVYNMHARNEGIRDGVMFSNGQALFDFNAVQVAPGLRMMEQDFGILPYPKYNEADVYMSSVSPMYLSIAVIPKTNRDIDNTGIIMEELAYQGYKNLRPAFYDKLLQGKVARDNESLEMLDYLFDNVVYDVGAMWNIANFTMDFISLVSSYDLNITSFIEARRGQIESDIEKIMEAVE